jgi:D-psicose/D-tagatose/L-ribulose 3-epimerase
VVFEMKLGLIENAWWGSNVSPLEAIEFTKKIGFDTYDLMPISEPTPPEKRELLEKFDEVGLPCSAITCFSVSVIDLNRAVRRFTVDWLKKQLDFGYEMGCDKMVLALGEYSLEKIELKPELQWGWAVELVRELGDYADGLKMDIALETLAHKYALLNSGDLLKGFIDEVDHRRVKGNADLSHLYLAGNLPSSLNKLKGDIAHVHISDCKDGIHGDLPPGRGDVPLKQYLEALRKIGFDGDVMVELEWRGEVATIREWVKEAYRATAKMMDDLHVRA